MLRAAVGAVGADIGAHGRSQACPRSAEDRAVAIAGDLQLALGVARMIGGEQMLAAVLDPFDRPAGQARGKRNEKILGIELAARAEAAADVVLHHADGAFRQAPFAWPGCGD